MPQDPDFPSDCIPDEWTICPDPNADQNTLSDCLDWCDGKELTDKDAQNPLTPFTLDEPNKQITIAAGTFDWVLDGYDGIKFTVASVNKTIRWGHEDAGPKPSEWHADRVSCDGHDIATVAPV